MVSTHVVDLGLLDERPDLRLLQMLDLVTVRCGKIGAETAVLTCDNDTAAAGRLLFIDAVFDADAFLRGGGLEDLGVLVLADGSNIDD